MRALFPAVFLVCSFFADLAFAEATPVVVAVGVNRSFDPNLPQLAFAETDAERFEHVMTTVGGVRQQDATLLHSPTADEFVQAVRLRVRATRAEGAGQIRLTVFFSGHADDRGLHFRGGVLSREKLHGLLHESGAETKVVFLDSCFSGSIAAKGVVADEAFDLPKLDLDELTGSVFLTASSAKEVAYESEQLSGSVFTHHLVAGLNGAADASSDGLVTVDELYQYIYRETKLRSMTYPGSGPQRPEYHADLHGNGALVISKPRLGVGVLRLDPGIIGSVHLASTSGLGSFDVLGPGTAASEYKVPEGSYRALIRRGDRVGEASILISRAETADLRPGQFEWHTIDMVGSQTLKGVINAAQATATFGMVSLQQALGGADLGKATAEAGKELLSMSTPYTRLSVMGRGALSIGGGELAGSSYSAFGSSAGIELVVARTGDAMRMTFGMAEVREWQDWEPGAGERQQVPESVVYRGTYKPETYVGALLPVFNTASGHFSVAFRRDFRWLADMHGRLHEVDGYTVGLALEP